MPEIQSAVFVTLQDIARYCGVSKWTVSAALRNNPRVNAETVARIQAVAAELGYDPSHHAAARRMALQKHGQRIINRQIALFLPPYFYHGNDYITAMFKGILDVTMAQQFGLLLGYWGDPQSKVHNAVLPPGFARGEVDGAIVYGMSTASLEGMQRAMGSVPLPVLSLITPLPECSHVSANYAEGAYQAARHLLELGHRHFLLHHLPGQDRSSTSYLIRIPGVMRALAEHNLDPSRHLHLLPLLSNWSDPQTLASETDNDGLQEADPTRRQLLDYLRANPEVTAIIGHNDPVAIHTWYTLARAGIRVPEEISLVGIDDTDPILDETGCNILTTVRTPLLDIGREAATLLIRRVNGEEAEEREIILPTQLIVRGTTAPARA